LTQYGPSTWPDKLTSKSGEPLSPPTVFLITQDLDFSDMLLYTPGTHAGLLFVRLSHPGRDALVERVAALFATEAVHQWQGCLVVATDHKVRVKRPI